MDRWPSEHGNPYQSPGAAADARGKLGWLIMLAILWPIVMAAVGSIIGFCLGRLAPDGVDREVWNPGAMALSSAAIFAVAGIIIGIRKATSLRRRLDEIHNRREEMRQELERRRVDTGREIGRSRSESASDGRAP